MNNLILNDVSLRESGQVEGGMMNPSDQIRYVQYLLEGGINRIEIGFPGSSEEQKRQCQRIAEHVHKWDGTKPNLSGLARAHKNDILAVKEAGCDMCHIYIPASDELMLAQFHAEKYGTTKDEKRKRITETAKEAIVFAKSLGFAHIEYSPEDAARAGKEFLSFLVQEVVEVGADIVNIPDTTGLRIGSEFGDLIAYLFANVADINRSTISVHCHNDSDHSTHNALQAVLAGARQVEGAFYGLGERSGMTKFEALLMNINTRRDIFKNVETDFDKSVCVKIVNFVGQVLGMPVPRHWVVAGSQNGIVSSGTHQAIEARAEEQGKESPYYSWNPGEYGHKGVEVVVTQSSGKAGLKKRLEKLGYNVSDIQLAKISERVKQISEAKSGTALKDVELTAIVQEAITEIPFPIMIKRCQTTGGKGTIPSATVVLEADSRIFTDIATGDGPFDAVMKAVKSAIGKAYPEVKEAQISLVHWHASALTPGTNAVADAYAQIKVVNGGDRIFSGKGADPDTIQASAQAFANCFSWYLASINQAD